MHPITEKLNSISIYDYMIVFLLVLGMASGFSGLFPAAVMGEAFLRFAFVPVFAVLLDISIKRFALKKPLKAPKSAFISGLFVAGILDPTAPIYIHLTAAALAILSKHILRMGGRNIFNPAGFGISLTSIIFTYILGINVLGSWWIGATLLTIPLGLYISYRMVKLPLTFSFYAVYALAAILMLKLPVELILEPSFISGYFFFASFMLLEPRTSAYTFKGMVVFGMVVALLSASLPLALPPVEFTLVSLMAMNIFKDLLDKRFPDS
jgi:Na+-translocating ferredoxin:NAD+ oxidoreductase RnfD subunit